MTLTSDISSYLQSAGIGISGDIVGTVLTPPNANIFENQMPPLPDECVSIFAYGGRQPSHAWSGEFPQVNIRVRAKTNQAAYDKAYTILTALHGVLHATINGTTYYLIEAQHSPASLGRDAKGRHLYSLNFAIVRERKS